MLLVQDESVLSPTAPRFVPSPVPEADEMDKDRSESANPVAAAATSRSSVDAVLLRLRATCVRAGVVRLGLPDAEAEADVEAE